MFTHVNDVITVNGKIVGVEGNEGNRRETTKRRQMNN